MTQSRVVTLLIALSISILSSELSWGQATVVPPGYVMEDLTVPGEMPGSVALAAAPDGRIFVGELLTGIIHMIHAGHRTVVGTVPNVVTGGENGFFGLAVDCEWPAEPYLYTYFTTNDSAAGPTNTLRRYTLEGDLDAVNHEPLSFGPSLDLITDVSALFQIHNAGGLRFGPDGMLYLSTGDGGPPCNSPDLTSVHGKILRLDVRGLKADRPGQIQVVELGELDPGDNPLAGPNPVTRLIYCYGLRNPFRFNIDPLTGALYIMDVGGGSFEEINIAFGGENYAWPYAEGVTPLGSCGPDFFFPPLTDPVFIGPHLPPFGFRAITTFGGLYSSQPQRRYDLGPNFDQNILFANIDLSGKLYRVENTPAGWAVPAPLPGQSDPLAFGETLLVGDAIIGDDGAIYCVSFGSGTLMRFRPIVPARNLIATGPINQVGTAGRAAPQPLAIRLENAQGLPLAHERVVFSIVSGNGTIDAAARTDANGEASVNYVFSLEAPSSRCRVLAHHDGAPPLVFDLTWRGLEMDLDYSRNGNLESVTLSVQHSAPGEEIALAYQLGPILFPFADLPSGPLWTSIAQPLPGFGLLSGATAYQGRLIADANGQAQRTLRITPGLSGFEFAIQAYSSDPALVFPDSLFFSNPVTLRVP